MVDYRFPRTSRLLTKKDFDRVFQKVRARSGGSTLMFLARENEQGYPRLGFALSKRHIKKAVSRNQVKRLVRESFRQLESFPALDVIVLARSRMDQVDKPLIRLQAEKSLKKLSDNFQRNRPASNGQT